MIESIAILNFIELCSLALVSTLDDILGNKLSYVDIESKKFKQLFFYYIKQETLPYKKRGLKVVIINSCTIQNNWRYSKNDYNYTYSVVDENLKISDRKISDVLDSFWKLLLCDLSYIIIRNKELDCVDLKSIIQSQIGSSHLVIVEDKLEYITDLNYLFHGNAKVPRYLEEEVIQILRNKKLIL